MTNPIPPISLPPLPPMQSAGAVGSAHETAGGESFKQMLLDSIQQVNAMQQDAHRSVEALASGEHVNPAEVLAAVQKADVAFRTMMQIRNKLVEAYQQVSNIRV